MLPNPDLSFRIAAVDTFVFRAPADPPVRTSFGIMRNRPAVLVRLTDVDGVQGWGEVWCNFPSVGAEHRARLIGSVLTQAVCAQAWASPQACFEALSRHVQVLAIQSGEPGPLAQAVAGIDIAIWDLVGRRNGRPLWQLFGGSDTVAVYTSGINPDHPERVAEAKAREGHTAFKLKVGFGDQRDEDNIRSLRTALGPSAVLMIDANQAWTPEQAAAMSRRLAPYDLTWLEEPLLADTPLDVWRSLAQESPIRLAGGENLRGEDHFAAAGDQGGLFVIQPDLGKWGGFSGCLPVGRYAMQRNRWFCPHWLGGGVGLTASMHLKAALGGPGYVEVDSNPNPLRDMLTPAGLTVHEGKVRLSDLPGLGIEPPLEALSAYLIAIQAD